MSDGKQKYQTVECCTVNDLMRLLAEVPEDERDKRLMLEVTVATGPNSQASSREYMQDFHLNERRILLRARHGDGWKTDVRT